MKRYLFLLFAFASLAFVFASCEKKEPKLTPVGALYQWIPSEGNVLFPSGCRIDEGEIEYNGLTYNLGSCDAILYSSKSEYASPYSVDIDFKCKLDSAFDVNVHDALVHVDGPRGEGYEETYIYIRGGFAAFLATSDEYCDYAPATTAKVYSDGVEYSVSSVEVYGVWCNNRELREKYHGGSTEDITKHLEYTDCNINIELNVEGTPLILHITHISPL